MDDQIPAGHGSTSSEGDTIKLLGRFSDRDAWTAEGWCSIERALELVGTRSAMILVREIFYGGRRFDDLAGRTGLSAAVASKRLHQLVDQGVLMRQPYQEPGARTRYEYVLTARGRSLFPVIVSLVEWGRALEPQRAGVELVHDGCGEVLEASVRCADGHDVAIDQAAARLVRHGRMSHTSDI